MADGRAADKDRGGRLGVVALSDDLEQGWRNWSGSLRFRPSRVEAPADEAALVALVRRTAREGRTLRPIGCCHSATPIIASDDILVSLERMTGLERHDPARRRAGTELKEAGRLRPNFPRQYRRCGGAGRDHRLSCGSAAGRPL